MIALPTASLTRNLPGDELDLLELVQKFVSREVRPRAREFEVSADYPQVLVQAMAEMGIFGLSIPTRYGGFGATAALCAAVYEEVGSAWIALADILSPHFSAARILSSHGTDQQRSAYLPRMAAGDVISAVALTEPAAGSDLSNLSTTTVREGGSIRVVGGKTMITHALRADIALVLTRLEAAEGSPKSAVVIVEAGDGGVTRTGSIDKLGHRGVELGEIFFDDVVLPSDRIVGDGTTSGMSQMLAAIDAGRAWVAAGALGMGRRAFELAVGYARDRHAFGTSLAEMPVVRHHLSDMWIDLASTTEMLSKTCEQLDLNAPRQHLSPMAAATKIRASETAQACAVRSMQLHGGYGYTKEHEIERIYRDTVITTVAEGTNDVLRALIARGIVN